jgi:hypothetical protein
VSRRLVPLALVLVVLAGCGGDLPRDEAGLVTVDHVALDVPEGWERVDDDADASLVTNTRFVDPDRRLQLLQVIAGCGEGGVDALVDAVGEPRGAFVVTGAFEATTEPEVAGLDRARRVTLELEPVGTDTAEDATIEAVYGEAGRALLLVELSLPVAGADVDAEAVLASLTVDGDALAASCD